MTRDQVLQKLRELKPELARDASVLAIAIFGSVARDEAHEGSDIDVLIEFQESPDAFAFLRLQQQLSDQLGGRVDLVTKRALHPALKDRILSEAVYA